MEAFGQPARSIEISFSHDLKENLIYRDLNLDSWESENVLYSATHDIEAILREYTEKYNFRKFEELADIRIGVVTGADRFFILDEGEARRHCFLRSHLVPIFTSSRDWCYFSGNGRQPRKRLLAFPIVQNTKYRDYIKKGLEEKYHLRSHSLRREPWYVIKSGETPDAFFPYRASNIPYLVLNDEGAQCTNSIHRVYFKDLSYESRKWVQISLLSVPGQLSLEAYSKTYGRGMLKVEPRALKKTLIFEGDGQNVGPVYDKISGLIANNDRIQAMKVATDFIDQKLEIATKLSKSAYSALIELQTRRSGR